MEEFFTKTRICFGENALEFLKKYAARKIWIVTDPFLVESGMIEQVTKHLAGREYRVFSNVVPDPPLELVVEGIKEVEDFLPDVIAYVKRGGTLLLPSGLPFYKDFQMDGRGGGRSVQVNDKYLADLHISWEAHWTGKGVPEQEKRQKTASRFSGKFS